MFRKLMDRWIDREVQRERDAMPLMDWEATLEEIAHLLEDNTVYLETRTRNLITLEEYAKAPRDIVGMAVAIAESGLKPWETKEPAAVLATKISNYLGRRAILLISRDPDLFVGYYVYIGPR